MPHAAAFLSPSPSFLSARSISRRTQKADLARTGRGSAMVLGVTRPLGGASPFREATRNATACVLLPPRKTLACGGAECPPRKRPRRPSRRRTPRRLSHRNSLEAALLATRALRAPARRHRQLLQRLVSSLRRRRQRIDENASAPRLPHRLARRVRRGSLLPRTSSTCLPGSALRSGERLCRSTRPRCSS